MHQRHDLRPVPRGGGDPGRGDQQVRRHGGGPAPGHESRGLPHPLPRRRHREGENAHSRRRLPPQLHVLRDYITTFSSHIT